MFCSLEKQNFIEKNIKCLEFKDGKIITDQKKVLGQVRKFYLNIFSENNLTKGIQTLMNIKITGWHVKY